MLTAAPAGYTKTSDAIGFIVTAVVITIILMLLVIGIWRAHHNAKILRQEISQDIESEPAETTGKYDRISDLEEAMYDTRRRVIALEALAYHKGSHEYDGDATRDAEKRID
jgi:sRNA-binding carbon storage regulator CsrA